jgi:hypothetical protein
LTCVPTLVWVRKELVVNRSFTPADGFLARGEYLLIPTKISFADLWGVEGGKKYFVEVVKMAGCGRGGGRFGGG